MLGLYHEIHIQVTHVFYKNNTILRCFWNKFGNNDCFVFLLWIIMDDNNYVHTLCGFFCRSIGITSLKRNFQVHKPHLPQLQQLHILMLRQ